MTISNNRPDWDDILKMKADEFDLSEEEKRQLKNNSEFVSWEDVIRCKNPNEE